MRYPLVLAAVGAVALAGASRAAEPLANPYNPLETFAPLSLPDPANAYRSADGAPGPDYWQNRADYQIAARLDPATKTLSGEETITYTNNSPDALDVLWLQLDQNIYRQDARSAAVGGGFRRTQFTDGDVLDAVEVEKRRQVRRRALCGQRHALAGASADRAGATAARPASASPITTPCPGVFGGRTAWIADQHGEVYDIAQWYPRMAVYDDVRGWDPLPYLGQEFYLEYGTFDYAVTVPADMIVAGSGALMNPDEVLTPLERARLAQARASDKTVMIRTADEVVATPPASGTKTWRFHMDQTRDVSFAASRAFVWDAARVNLPDGKTALAQSVYPAESGGDGAWGRSTEYLKFAIEEFSRRWFPTPGRTRSTSAGRVGGMEYPACCSTAWPTRARTCSGSPSTRSGTAISR